MKHRLYRGQTKEGEWVIGFLFPEDTIHVKIRDGVYDDVIVKTETVGQHIGQQDKHGKDIFEDDIDVSEQPPMVVVYEDDQYGLRYKNSDDVDTGIDWTSLDIAGSIHDQSDLLVES